MASPLLAPEEAALLVQPVAEDEWERVRDLRKSALEADGSRFLPGCLERESDFSEVDWRATFTDASWVVASVGGLPVGVARVARFANTDEWYIEGVWVKPSHRRRGIARAMVEQLLAIVRGQGVLHVMLWVMADNPDAQKLYQDALGFFNTGELQIPEGGMVEERLFSKAIVPEV